MVPRVVIDTNIFVSAAISARGKPASVLDLVAAHKAILCVSQPILAEYEGVLLCLKLRLDPDRVRWLLVLARQEGVVVKPTRTLDVSPDEADNRFWECADACAADFLVTGNIKDFPQEFKTTKIVTPQQFMSRMKEKK